MSKAQQENIDPKKAGEEAKNEKDKKDQPVEEELNEEDQMLKEKLEICVKRIQESDVAQRDNAFQLMSQEIRSATSSMTSVPKPLKFLFPHYKEIVAFYDAQPNSDFKQNLSDVLSVIAMVAAEDQDQDCLKYCISGTKSNLQQWGQEYLRSLAGDVAKETQKRFKEAGDQEVDFSDLMFLVEIIVPYNMNHNSESEAVDFLMELDKINILTQHANEHNYERVCSYLLACAPYSADYEDSQKAYNTAYDIYMSQKKFVEATRVALKMGSQEKYTQILNECKDATERKQIGFLIGRQRAALDTDLDIEEDLNQIISNTKLSEYFKQLGRDLDVLEPKTAEQTLKTHLEERKNDQVADSAKQNLATTYVNGFVNAAFCKDLLMTVQEGDNWVHKNKEHGMMAASASLGLLMLWDIDQGLTDIDKFTNVQNEYIVAGAYIGIGIVNSGIQNECDPVYAILHEALENPQNKQIVKIGALIGLSLTYAGSKREDLLDEFSPIILDSSNSIELQAVAALSIGLVYVGSCNEDAAQSILQTLMERESKDLEHPFAKLFSLGLGLLFLGQEDNCEASLEACGVLQDQNFSEYTKLVIETLAFSGTGNVLKIQKLLHLLSEHKTEDKEALHQVAAVLGVAFIAFGEDVGSEMCLRTLNQLLTYGEPIIKKIVPLAVGLLRISNPEVATIDMLTKLAYDSNAEIAQNAIFALGLVGSGSNNSRLAGNLRMLASYYHTNKDILFVVRLAQGLVHLGKGLLTLNPLHSDKFLYSRVQFAGLIITLFAASDMPNFLLGNHHYFLYYLVLSMYPKMCLTLNENLEPVQTQVRVGQAVDTVGAAGKPKKITGFQTHDTPVLVSHGERAELATEQYLPVTPILENFVILRENPDWEPEEEDPKKKRKMMKA